MPNTHLIRRVGVTVLHTSNLSSVAQFGMEGASQTFTKGTPIDWSAGLLVAATSAIETDASNTLVGLSLIDGGNVAAALQRSKFIPAIDGVTFFANLLTGDGATYTFAQADIGVAAGGTALRSKSGLIVTGDTDWFLDAADTNGCKLVGQDPDMILPNVAQPRIAVGDIDVRIPFVFLAGVRSWE